FVLRSILKPFSFEELSVQARTTEVSELAEAARFVGARGVAAFATSVWPTPARNARKIVKRACRYISVPPSRAAWFQPWPCFKNPANGGFGARAMGFDHFWIAREDENRTVKVENRKRTVDRNAQ